MIFKGGDKTFVNPLMAAVESSVCVCVHMYFYVNDFKKLMRFQVALLKIKDMGGGGNLHTTT